MTNKLDVKKYVGSAKKMYLGSEHNKIFDEIMNATAFPFGSLTLFTPARPRSKAEQTGFIQPRINITGDEKSWQVAVEIPGVEEKDLIIEMKDNSLVISGEKKQELEEKSIYHMERSFGSFRRVIAVPEDIKGDEVFASYKNGVLKITLPRQEQIKEEPRKIEIVQG